MNDTAKPNTTPDRAHLWAALSTIQDAHQCLCLGNAQAGRVRLKVGAKALHEYLKATTPHPEELPEGMEEVG